MRVFLTRFGLTERRALSDLLRALGHEPVEVAGESLERAPLPADAIVAPHPHAASGPEALAATTVWPGADLDAPLESRAYRIALVSSGPGVDAVRAALASGADDVLFDPPVACDVEARLLLAARRKRIATERRAANERLASLYRGSKDAIATCALDGTLLDLNDAFQKLTGYSRAELGGGTRYQDLTPPEYAELEASRIAEVLRTGEPVEYEKEYIRKDGSRVPIRLSVFAVPNPDGTVERIGGFVRDVTEWRKMLAALRETESTFRQLAENIDEVFWLTPIDVKAALYVSPAYERVWGRSRESIVSDPESWLDAIHSEDREPTLARIAASGSAGYEAEYRIIRPDGEVRWIRDRAFPVRDEAGNVFRFAGIAEDITFQKLAEADRVRAERLSTVRHLAVALSHEINNDLQRIIATTQLLRASEEVAPRVRDDLMDIEDVSFRIASVVKRLRALEDVRVVPYVGKTQMVEIPDEP